MLKSIGNIAFLEDPNQFLKKYDGLFLKFDFLNENPSPFLLIQSCAGVLCATDMNQCGSISPRLLLNESLSVCFSNFIYSLLFFSSFFFLFISTLFLPPDVGSRHRIVFLPPFVGVVAPSLVWSYEVGRGDRSLKDFQLQRSGGSSSHRRVLTERWKKTTWAAERKAEILFSSCFRVPREMMEAPLMCDVSILSVFLSFFLSSGCFTSCSLLFVWFSFFPHSFLPSVILNQTQEEENFAFRSGSWAPAAFSSAAGLAPL